MRGSQQASLRRQLGMNLILEGAPLLPLLARLLLCEPRNEPALLGEKPLLVAQGGGLPLPIGPPRKPRPGVSLHNAGGRLMHTQRTDLRRRPETD
jgi:hypothetical protein